MIWPIDIQIHSKAHYKGVGGLMIAAQLKATNYHLKQQIIYHVS